MQIKPRQIPHFARQRERFKGLMNECKYILTWYGEDRGSYFSKRWQKSMNIDFNFSYDTIDSHGDIHVKGCFGKSINKAGNIPYLLQHNI